MPLWPDPSHRIRLSGSGQGHEANAHLDGGLQELIQGSFIVFETSLESVVFIRLASLPMCLSKRHEMALPLLHQLALFIHRPRNIKYCETSSDQRKLREYRGKYERRVLTDGGCDRTETLRALAAALADTEIEKGGQHQDGSRAVSLAKDLVHYLCAPSERWPDLVPVDQLCGGGAVMASEQCDALDGNAVGGQNRHERVPHLPRCPIPAQRGLLGGCPERAGHIVGAQRCTDRRGEDQAVVLPQRPGSQPILRLELPVLPERFDTATGKRQGPP